MFNEKGESYNYRVKSLKISGEFIDLLLGGEFNAMSIPAYK